MRNYERFLCPKCGGKLHQEGHSLYCENRHCYDVASSGYVNLANVGKGKEFTGDSKEMTAARHRILSMGYYSGVLFHLTNLLADMDERFRFIIDCGCGEGTFISHLANAFPSADIVGVDLSKSAINVASKAVKEAAFAIANSSDLPFESGTADILLCAFTPVFPDEIRRVLRTHGCLVTVTPGEKHLWQLKEQLYENPYKNKEFDFEDEYFDEVCTMRVQDNFTVKGEDVGNLLQMTPYYYKTSPQAVERVSSLPELTTETEFIIGIYEKVKDDRKA